MLHAEEAFRSASATSLGLALGAAALASLVASLLLTRRIDRSLGALSTAAAGVAGGRFDARVPPPGIGAEFEDLAVAFNDMAARLDESHALRRRLLADVAHELRTPVTTITAYLEGVGDGVESLTPDTIAVLCAQGSRLFRLAAVTRAESRDLALHPEPTAPAELLTVAARSAAGRFAARDVSLIVDTDDGLPDVVVDRDRIGQVLGNLLDNALLHTLPRAESCASARHARTAAGCG